MTMDMQLLVKIRRLSSVNVEVLGAAKTLGVADYAIQWLDPSGVERDVSLPAEASSENLIFLILNTGSVAGFDLVVKNDTPATVATLGPGQTGIFSCDGTNWKHENDIGIYYDAVDNRIEIVNDGWLSGLNNAGSDVVNILKVNVDDEIDVGGTLVVSAAIDAAEDSGMVTLADMPVSATPASGTKESFTIKIDGDNIITFGAEADSAGGVTGHFVKMHGAVMKPRKDGGAADYNPSILTSDYLITVDNTAAARAVTISTEDVQSGSLTEPRFFIIKDEKQLAGTNNITVALESGTIDGNASHVINANGNAITLYTDGTNGYVI